MTIRRTSQVLTIAGEIRQHRGKKHDHSPSNHRRPLHVPRVLAPEYRAPRWIPVAAVVDMILQMEFTLYALRNPANRTRLAEHQRRWRHVIEAVVRADCERLGVDPPIPVEDAAAMILAMDNGYLLGELIEPGSYETGTFSRHLLMLQQLFESATRAEAVDSDE